MSLVCVGDLDHHCQVSWTWQAQVIDDPVSHGPTLAKMITDILRSAPDPVSSGTRIKDKWHSVEAR